LPSDGQPASPVVVQVSAAAPAAFRAMLNTFPVSEVEDTV
jgi:hypothetical protein